MPAPERSTHERPIPVRLTPRRFTAEAYAARMARAVAGLSEVPVGPGPDMVRLPATTPTVITERLTLLVPAPDQEPTLAGVRAGSGRGTEGPVAGAVVVPVLVHLLRAG
jgi:hypothetical protein